ncbi:MAG: hypothetical protein ACR2KP_07415 [Egibacteraceae bacterium]
MTSGRVVAAAVMLLVWLAACGQAIGPVGEPSAVETARESPTPDPTASPVVPVAAGSVTPSPLEARLEHRFAITGDPEDLVAGPNAMWLKRANGMVDRIDPATNEIVYSVEVMNTRGGGGHHCLGVGGGSVWACDENNVERLDPATGEVIATVAVGKVFDQVLIPVSSGHAWILSDAGATLLGVDLADNAVDVEVPLGTRCADLAAHEDMLWAACPLDDMVLRIDPATEQVTARIGGLERPRWLAAAEDVWVAFDHGLARVEAETAEVTGAVDVKAGGIHGGLFVTADTVWVRAREPFLRRVDPATMELVEEITTDSRAGGAVTVAFGSIWASAPRRPGRLPDPAVGRHPPHRG